MSKPHGNNSVRQNSASKPAHSCEDEQITGTRFSRDTGIFLLNRDKQYDMATKAEYYRFEYCHAISEI